MKKGFKLKDGSIWTVLSYTVLPEYENALAYQIPLSAITEVTGVQYNKECSSTYPHNVSFTHSLFQDFKTDDPRIESISNDVFDYIGEEE